MYKEAQWKIERGTNEEAIQRLIGFIHLFKINHLDIKYYEIDYHKL